MLTCQRGQQLGRQPQLLRWKPGQPPCPASRFPSHVHCATGQAWGGRPAQHNSTDSGQGILQRDRAFWHGVARREAVCRETQQTGQCVLLLAWQLLSNLRHGSRESYGHCWHTGTQPLENLTQNQCFCYKPLKSFYPFKNTDSQEVENRLEQCFTGDADAPSLALYPKGPALPRAVQTRDQLVAPAVAGDLCPGHQDLKAVMLPSSAHPHSTFTHS